MRGVILAGGLGTRLRPLTDVTNKNLLPVYDRPMIYYPIRCLLNAGIDEILIVTGGNHAGDFMKVLKDGRHLGVRHLAYAYQEGSGGVAQALSLAEEFVAGEQVCVVLSDNLIQNNICHAAHAFRKQPSGAKIMLKEVPDPQRFGVAQIEDGRVVRIIEKPQNPPSSLAVIGIYFYDKDVFDICRRQKPSQRGEMEITDVNNTYLARGDLSYDVLDGWWTDAGTIESLYEATCLVAKMGANQMSRSTAPDSTSRLDRLFEEGHLPPLSKLEQLEEVVSELLCEPV